MKNTLQIFISMMAGALTIAWALIFRDYLVTKLELLNVFGLDTEIFMLIILGVIIMVLAYFGIVKKKK